MDPLSIAAGVAGLVSLTIQLVQLSSAYVGSVRGASNSVRTLNQELLALQRVLTQLKHFLETQKDLGPFHVTSALVETNEFCRVKLEALLANLECLGQKKKFVQRLRTLKWPLDEAQNKETLLVLHRCVQTYSFSLTIAGCSLLAKNSTEVSELLLAQAKSLEEVQNITGVVTNVMTETLNSCKQTAETMKMVKEHTAIVITISDGVNDMKQALDELSPMRTHNWLQAPDPTSNHIAAQDRRDPSTGDWVFSDKEFRTWKHSPNSFLWLTGIAGSGKTIISSTIINHMLVQSDASARKTDVAYFYFDFRTVTKQTTDALLRSLVTQLADRSPTPACINRLFGQFGKEMLKGLRTVGENDLIATFKDLLREIRNPIYVVLDALDECTQVSGLMFLLRMFHLWQCDHLHLLVLSRQEKLIQDTFDPLKPLRIDLSEAANQDIDIYIQNQLATSQRLLRWTRIPEIRRKVESTLSMGARGMFRWVALQIEQLETCLTLEALEQTLGSLPEGLDQTYDRILLNVNPKYLSLTTRALYWLAVSCRPLSIQELAEAASIAPELPVGQRISMRRQLLDPKDILLLCSSLILVSKRDKEHADEYQWGEDVLGNVTVEEVHLSHFSVKEYLLSPRREPFVDMPVFSTESSYHRHVAEACLCYLLQFDKSDSLMDYTKENWPLATYTARYWWIHAKKCDGDGDTSQRLLSLSQELLQRPAETFYNLLRLYDPEKINWQEVRKNKDFSNLVQEQVPNPLYLTAQFGLKSIAIMLITCGEDVNATSGREGSALQISALTNNIQIAELLLQNGANVEGNAPENVEACATPLCAATIKNNVEMAKLLLDNGADPNARGSDDHHVWYGSPLYHAYRSNYDELTSILLQHGARPEGYGSLTEEIIKNNIYTDAKTTNPILSTDYALALLRSGGRRAPLPSPTPTPESQAQRQSDLETKLASALFLVNNRSDTSL